jgi:ariadne-1
MTSPTLIVEYDDYGLCTDPDDTVDLFTMIDLESKSSEPSKHRETVFVSALADESVDDTITKSCRTMAEQLGVHEGVAYLLLGSKNWNMHNVYESWDRLRGSMLAKIGVSEAHVLSDPSLRHPVECPDMCIVCGDSFPLEEFWCLQCGHAFCTSCWRDQIKAFIEHGALQICCLMDECTCKMPPSCVNGICGREIYGNILTYIRDRQVAAADTLTNCPNPSCSKPINLLSSSLCNVMKCVYCRLEFCLECHEPSHVPASCSEKQIWETSTGAEIMQQRLFGENVKKCPNCKAIIEKNGGCNHMTCKACAHEFCWMCGGAWSSHPKTHYHCDAYKVENDPYLKKPDNINPKFIAKYHDEYQRFTVKAQAIRDTSMAKVVEIQRKVVDESRHEDSTAVVVRAMLDQFASATRVIAWSHVHLFCARFEQVSALAPESQMSVNVPPLTPHQQIFSFMLAALVNQVTQVETRIVKLGEANGRIKIAECVGLTRALGQYKDALLRQCDPHFKSPAEWAMPGKG